MSRSRAGGHVGQAIDVTDLFVLHRGRGSAGDVAALRGLSLAVARGERLVVHGPNGAGKSTLLRVLTGEQRPSAGRVRIEGVDVGGADEATLTRLRSRTLGLVDQHHSRSLRPELDALDNVALQLRLAGEGRRSSRRAATDLLDGLGLRELARRAVATLSAGEAQRVAVCAALVHLPAVVLADEPTGDLDAAAADQVYDLLAAVVAAAGATLVLVTHDARAARVADRVVRIRDGRVSEQRDPAEGERESLLLDDRGWLRLPEALRRDAGIGAAVRAELSDGGVVLRATGPDPRRAPLQTCDPPGRPSGTTPGPEANQPPGAVATMRGVARSLSGRSIVSGVDLDLLPSHLTVLQGPSGTGKSTLLRLLVGLDRPDAGEVRVAGEDLAHLDRSALAGLRRRYVAVAGQGTSLAESLDVTANLILVRRLRGLPDAPALVARAAEAVGLSALGQRRVSELSGGERQRLSVARVVVAEGRLAVLDEPTSKLDESGALLVARVLADLAADGAAVVCATHDPVVIAAGDEVVDVSSLVPRVGFEPTTHRV